MGGIVKKQLGDKLYSIGFSSYDGKATSFGYKKIEVVEIEKAKEKLSTTDLSVSEIAYELGFEHSQSFSKLFKTKTRLSPSEFRLSFN